MDTSTIRYPSGRCSNCEVEFNSELRNEYHITHCPYCGVEIDDFLSAIDKTQQDERVGDHYCEDCGRRIYSRGVWIDKCTGVCEGSCERELCSLCADWKDGMCKKCRESNRK